VPAIPLYRGEWQPRQTWRANSSAEFPKTAPNVMHAAFEFLRSQPGFNKRRIAAIGWCIAGGYSPDVAREEPRLAAAVNNYGHLATDPETLKKISASILGLSRGQDHGITPDDVDKLEAAMKQQGKKIEIKIYDDVGHACENPNHQGGYRPAADAGKRGVSFLAENLKN
jgi:carboxymethylenebutenolidase